MRLYVDGYSTQISFANLLEAGIAEKDVTPPGISAGGPIDTTTMRNSAWRTATGKQLKTLTPISATVTFSFLALAEIRAQVGINQLVTVTFPDGASVVFYGWIEEFTPGAFTEGEQPVAQLTIQPSLRDSSDTIVEPEWNDVLITLLLAIEEIEEFLFKAETSAFRIRITNDSETPLPAEGVVVTITLPTGLAYSACDLPVTQDGQVITITIPVEIALGDSYQFDMGVIPAAAITYVVEGSVTADSPLDEQLSTLIAEHEFTVFDRTACVAGPFLDAFPVVAASGGDTFDCYPEGTITDNKVLGFLGIALLGGTSWNGNWYVADSPFFLLGDTLDTYLDQDPIVDSLNAGTGFASAWKFD